MDVMYCGDRGILRGVLRSAASLAEHTEEDLVFHLVTGKFSRGDDRWMPLGSKDVAFLARAIGSLRPGVRFALHDVSDAFVRQPPAANMGTRFTPGCMLRLYIDLIEGFPGRVLYLDYDVLFRADPAELFNTPMDGVEFAAVPDYYGQWLFMGGPFTRTYLNSGVMLMNVDEMRATGLLAACRKRCAEQRMFMPDQTALNKLARTKKALPRRFNEQRRTRPDTVIRHFCTSWRFVPYPHTVCVKPWDVDRLHSVFGLHEYDDLLASCQRWEESYECL